MMKPRNLVLTVVALLVFTAVVWLIAEGNRGVRPMQPSTQTRSIPLAKPQATPVAMTSAAHMSSTPPGKAHQMPDSPISATQLASSASVVMPRGSYQGMNDPRWPIYWKKREQDQTFEWKTPISFYGKVVDQNQQPIPGVEVSMNWTDMSPKGTSDATRTTDADGMFSITDIQGKNFGVRYLKKDGYEEAKASNRYSFEYAGFWEPTYHEPDPNNPVIFHMRKEGEPAPLVSSKNKSVLTFGAPFPVPMPQTTGAASPIKVTVFESDGKARKWKAQVTVEGGGIVPALEEFPFEAPTDGYQNSIILDQDSPQPPGWQNIDEGGWFYIKTAQGYGLLELRQMKGKKTLHYRVLLNPTGSTNLEPAR